MSQPQLQPRPRRTVTITGRPDKVPVRRHSDHAPGGVLYSLPQRGPRVVELDRRRPPRRTIERVGPRPDRVAMWAVIMALFLIVVTITSSHG
jgi:hypothetical protein